MIDLKDISIIISGTLKNFNKIKQTIPYKKTIGKLLT